MHRRSVDEQLDRNNVARSAFARHRRYKRRDKRSRALSPSRSLARYRRSVEGAAQRQTTEDKRSKGDVGGALTSARRFHRGQKPRIISSYRARGPARAGSSNFISGTRSAPNKQFLVDRQSGLNGKTRRRSRRDHCVHTLVARRATRRVGMEISFFV